MTWFTEERTATSPIWAPVLYRERPEIGKDMRVGKTGSRVRRQPVEVAAEHERLSLTALRKIYGADPKGETK